jgi:hypothetical protein
MKKFVCEYNHMGKRYGVYLHARNFAHAQTILNDGYLNNEISLFDFADNYTAEEKKLRLRDAQFNGELMEVVFSVSLPF